MRTLSTAIAIGAGIAATSAQAQLTPGWTSTRTTVSNVKPGASGFAIARCRVGEHLLGGGYDLPQTDRGVVVMASGPMSGAAPAGWSVEFKNLSTIEIAVTVTVFVGCTPAAPLRRR